MRLYNSGPLTAPLKFERFREGRGYDTDVIHDNHLALKTLFIRFPMIEKCEANFGVHLDGKYWRMRVHGI